MTATKKIHSIGHAAQILQLMPGKIREFAEELGIKPAVTINGIDHYAEADLQRIREWLAEERRMRGNS